MHPAPKVALLEWRTQSHRTQPTEFVCPSRLYGGRKALDLAAVLKREIRPAFEQAGITGVGWHMFRHSAGTVLAELDEHQLMIGDYLRHANLSVTTSTCKRHRKQSGMLRRGWLRRFCRRICCQGKPPKRLYPYYTQIPVKCPRLLYRSNVSPR